MKVLFCLSLQAYLSYCMDQAPSFSVQYSHGPAMITSCSQELMDGHQFSARLLQFSARLGGRLSSI